MSEVVSKQMYDALVAVDRDWHERKISAIQGTGVPFRIADELRRRVSNAIKEYEKNNANPSEAG